jgi:hypothetical protein
LDGFRVVWQDGNLCSVGIQVSNLALAVVMFHLGDTMSLATRDAIMEKLYLLLSQVAFTCSTEKELQDAVASTLALAGWTAEREVEVAPGDRIDFLVGDVGIELKVSGATMAVNRQLHRYLGSSRIAGLLLVTTKMRHRAVARELQGKPVAVVCVGAWT